MARGTFTTSNTLISNSSQGAPFTDYPFTVAMWFYLNDTVGYHVLFSCTDGDIGTSRNLVGVKDGDVLHYASNSEYVHTGLSVSASTWYHLVWHCSSATSRKATLNATTDEIATSRAFGTSANRWSVGIVADSTPSSPADGYVDSVGAWNIAFSDAEAAAMYNHRLSPLDLHPENLVLYAPLNDGAAGAQEWIGGRALTEAGTVGTFAGPPRNHRSRSFLFPFVVASGTTMAADPGAFSVTGTAATTDTASPVSSGTFAITGTAATTDTSSPVSAAAFTVSGTAITTDIACLVDAGSFSVTGTAATSNDTIPVSPGTFVVTGTAASLGPTVTATAGSYDITGTVATTNDTCPVDPGSFTSTGTAVTIDNASPVTTGSFVVTGTDATLIPPGTTMAADPGAFTVSGTATTSGLAAPVTAGAFSVSGSAVTTIDTCPVASGGFVVAGTDATLIPPSGVTMAADPGAFAITGTAAASDTASPVTSGTWAVSGTAATTGLASPVTAGGWLITGTDATLISDSSVDVLAGSFVVSGTAATMANSTPVASGTWNIAGTATTSHVSLSTTAGAFSVTGIDVTFDSDTGVASGAFVFTGTAVTTAIVCTVSPGIIAVSPTAANLVTTTPVDSGSVVVTGTDATFASTLAAAPGAFTFHGVYTLDTLAGAFVVTGSPIFEPVSTGQPIGFNVAQPSYFGYSKPLIDVGGYLSWYGPIATPPGVNETTGDLVSGNGQILLWTREGEVFEAGTYEATFTGGGTFDGQSSPATFTVTAGLQSKNFNATAPVLNLSIKKQGATGTYEPTFTTRANHASCLRFMRAWRTNESTYQSATPWVRKPTPTGANQFFHPLWTPTDLANICKDFSTDLWITIHHLATNADVTAIANEIAATGFSGTLYVEHSNEVWNSSFPQYSYALTQIGGYGGPGDAYNVQAWHADRTHTIGGLVKAVIPSAVVVWGSQMVNSAFITNALTYAQTDLSNIDAAAIGYYFGGPWSRAQTPAFILGLGDDSIADNAEAQFNSTVKPAVTAWKAACDARSWRLLAYEGGSHLDHADSAAEAHLSLSSQSVEMGVVYDHVLDWWYTNVGDLLLLFEDVGPPTDPWSHSHGELLTPAPRWQSFIERTQVGFMPGLFDITGTAATFDVSCPVESGQFAITAGFADLIPPEPASGSVVNCHWYWQHGPRAVAQDADRLVWQSVCPEVLQGVTVDSGAFVAAGVAIVSDTLCPVESGLFSVTGSGIGGAKTMVAESGAVAISGTAITTGTTMVAAPGTVAVVGTPAALTYQGSFLSGTYSVLGTNATTELVCPVGFTSWTVDGEPAWDGRHPILIVPAYVNICTAAVTVPLFSPP